MQQVAAFVQQGAPGGRELGAVAAAVKQQHVQVFLQLAHHVGERGGHFAHLVRGGGKAALALDGVKNFQGFERECHVQKF